MLPALQSVLAFSISFAGLYLLWLAWKNRGSVKLSWIGWGLIICSLILWALIGGNDRGVAIGLIVISLQALGLIGARAWLEKGKASKKKASKTPVQITVSTSWSTYLARTGVAVLIGPIAGVVAFVFSLGIHEVLLKIHAYPANAFTTAVYTFPIVWASLSVFLLISDRAVFKTILLTLMTVSGASVLVLGS